MTLEELRSMPGLVSLRIGTEQLVGEPGATAVQGEVCGSPEAGSDAFWFSAARTHAIFNRALTDDERRSVENLLRAEHGLKPLP